MRKYTPLLLALSLLAACTTQTTVLFTPTNTPEGYEKLIKAVPAVYPHDLVQWGIEGWVVVEYTITEKGRVEDAVIHAEYPEGLFSKAALNAVKKYIYQPRKVDGKPVKVTGKLHKLNFNLSNGGEERTCENAKSGIPNNDQCYQLQ